MKHNMYYRILDLTQLRVDQFFYWLQRKDLARLEQEQQRQSQEHHHSPPSGEHEGAQ